MFVHEDPQFDGLIRIVAEARGISRALVEKDYWVTHALWSLQRQGFETWLKGGTSLSKGFGLIQRFSEDLDLKIEAGSVAGIPPVEDRDWDRKSTKAKGARRARFEALEQRIVVAGTTIERDPRSTSPTPAKRSFECCTLAVFQTICPLRCAATFSSRSVSRG